MFTLCVAAPAVDDTENAAPLNVSPANESDGEILVSDAFRVIVIARREQVHVIPFSNLTPQARLNMQATETQPYTMPVHIDQTFELAFFRHPRHADCVATVPFTVLEHKVAARLRQVDFSAHG